MNNYLPLLQTTTLFAGLSAAELSTLLSRLGGSVRSYGKGEALVLAGEPSRRVGIVLSGELEAYRPAPGGVRIPIARVEPGGVFGDVLGGSSLSSPVTVLETAELALPPQAARLIARLNASSKDRIFFMKYSFSHPARPGTGSGNRSFFENFAKSFALRVPVYYNRGKNTVACAT